MKQPARVLLRPLAIGAFRFVDRLRSAPHRYILILSHMRSGSSLLLHLLMTSSQVSGCGERNTVYRNERDLVTLAIKANYAQREKRWASYSVDQINHTRFVPSDDLLLHPSVYPVVLIREPRHAINSMVNVLGQHYEFGIDDAHEYYRKRISTLTQYANLLREHGRIASLTYDELVNDTPNSLLKLKGYLGLSTELSDRYPTYDFTSIRGDPSSRILAGQIVANHTIRTNKVESSDSAELMKLFRECLRASRNICNAEN